MSLSRQLNDNGGVLDPHVQKLVTLAVRCQKDGRRPADLDGVVGCDRGFGQ
jgi:hypothetical protein